MICHVDYVIPLFSVCPALATTEYLKRHNYVASLIHKHVCEFYGIPTCEKPWFYNPQPVVLSGGVKILWDLDVRTDCVISAHRPEIVIYDCVWHSATLLDVSIPADFNIVEKEHEKIQKYQDLCLEFGIFEQSTYYYWYIGLIYTKPFKAFGSAARKT